ncbi:MAG: tetratricopeptide repeat protein [Alphaproteobacteria bacterium]|nr:MAG: tetratricopeptide repeat protein [Alphaproteobacteria bacterium]
MGWVMILVLASAALLALWRLARLDNAALQFAAAALLFGIAGYAWQGRPTLAGAPANAAEKAQVRETDFSRTREDVLGRFDTAWRWLNVADGLQRTGDTKGAVDVIRSAIRAHPEDPDLWIGLGNALVVHGNGIMSPAADLAFRRAEALEPGHPAPRFFYAVALAEGGRFADAETIWQDLLATTPANLSWRPLIEQRVQAVEQIRAARMIP